MHSSRILAEIRQQSEEYMFHTKRGHVPSAKLCAASVALKSIEWAKQAQLEVSQGILSLELAATTFTGINRLLESIHEEVMK